MDQVRLPQAWNYNPGHGLVAVVDTGLQWNHPNLRAFSGTAFVGGNFLTAGSYDVVYPGSGDNTVDERRPVPATHTACDNGNGLMVPSGAGHGTHVGGLVGARTTANSLASGACRHCGLYMMKMTVHDCDDISQPPWVTSQPYWPRVFAALQIPIRIGAQVLNASFGASYFDLCQPTPPATRSLRSSCLVLEIAESRDAIVVAASGNNRQRLQFPAEDSRVVAVGGLYESSDFWDESPGSVTNCPVIPGLWLGDECGSNYSPGPGSPEQELVAGARDVISTFYTGASWNTAIRCTDDADDIGTAGDGISPCTGTSMSSPIVAGIFGLLRSTNPLLRAGDPGQSVVYGLRNVLAATTDRAQQNLPWHHKFGHGTPDAEAAVKQVLGKVAGVPVKNRATPLFGLYGSGAKDHVQTTSPQKAVAFAINQTANYSQSIGAQIPGYPAFPPDPEAPLPPTPRAIAYVMTTPNKPAATTPNLVPLYQMAITRNWPAGCTSGPSCNTNNRNFLLVSTIADVQVLKLSGYQYYGREGYVYERCTPEPQCIPVGAERLWRKCKSTDDDCAVFLERDRAQFENNGYVALVPAGGDPLLGYAYPAIDTDGDGLIDGFEYLIGTDPLLTDTDGDGVPDGVEFPLASVSFSDPCIGPMAWRCAADLLFADGFE